MANSNNFTNQKPFVCDEEDCKKSWSFGKNGSKFRCNLCGHSDNCEVNNFLALIEQGGGK